MEHSQLGRAANLSLKAGGGLRDYAAHPL